MDRIRGGVDYFEGTRRVAAAGREEFCCGNRTHFLCAAAEIEENRGSEFADCVPGMERCTAQSGCARDAAEFGLDGGGVCAVSEIFEREYRANCRAGWP